MNKGHRIREVRLREAVTLRTAARRLGTCVTDIRQQEDPASDLRLSDLYRWQAALNVPILELLVDVAEPAPSILERSRLVRVMKTAGAIFEQAPDAQVKRMAENLIEQLLEVMPELREVSPWHRVGQLRPSDELGRIADHPIEVDLDEEVQDYA